MTSDEQTRLLDEFTEIGVFITRHPKSSFAFNLGRGKFLGQTSGDRDEETKPYGVGTPPPDHKVQLAALELRRTTIAKKIKALSLKRLDEADQKRVSNRLKLQPAVVGILIKNRQLLVRYFCDEALGITDNEITNGLNLRSPNRTTQPQAPPLLPIPAVSDMKASGVPIRTEQLGLFP